MRYINHQELLNKTNGGLDIILWRYPNAQIAIDKPNTKFKIRNEKTASASLKRQTNGIYIVTDFGDDGKARDGIRVVMHEENCDFKTALQLIADRFNLVFGESKPQLIKAVFETRNATTEEEEGQNYFEIKDSFSDFEIKTIFAKKVIEAIQDKSKDNPIPENLSFHFQELLKTYHCYSLISFTQIKNRKALITKNTEEFPIFLFDYGEWKKIYQPLHHEKEYRFRYAGNRPKDYIFGLEECTRKFKDLNKRNDATDSFIEAGNKKLDNIILCSGDRDALNMAALGYNPIWLNSETANLSEAQYANISKITNDFYNLPDIDSTGNKHAHELAMKYLDIKTIRLPEQLKERKDFRGNNCKDIKDFLMYYSCYDLTELIKSALAYRFWEYPSEINNKKPVPGRISNLHCYNFLQQNGFFRYRNESKKEGYIFIHIEGNIVSEVDYRDIRDFINKFLESRKINTAVRNLFFRSTQLNESSLSNLVFADIDFKDYDKDSQYLFFKNRTWKVTKENITDLPLHSINIKVWKDEIIDHRVELLQEPFIIKVDERTKEYDIEIKDNSCLFFRFLINASRMHWRKELEKVPEESNWSEEQTQQYYAQHHFDIAGPNLSMQEVKEQKQHLCNKISTLGYLMHRYKDESKAFAIWAMDSKLVDNSESHGGSGKSLAFKAITHFMKSVTLDGRNPKLTDNPHVLENVSRHTDYLFIDDCHPNLKFDFFFSKITGSMDINPKNQKQSSIAFNESPKLCFGSNFGIRNSDPSTERRLLYTLFSDYYHFNKNREYKQNRTVADDLGKNLFQDFTEAEWNYFINFMAYCLKYYLKYGKIDPPMSNVSKRNLLAEMGAEFQSWADSYFSEENGKCDRLIPRKHSFNEFIEETNLTWTVHRFTKAIKLWCDYNDFTYNPKVLQNGSGRIIRRQYNKTVEMIYVQIKPDINPDLFTDRVEPLFSDN